MEGASLIKHLASCNKTTRDKALKLLRTWLPNQPQVAADDMKKIWKGLFYCVWHADKVPVQSELIDRLSSMLLSLDLSLSVHYFSVFLLTMRREWSGIDALRLDKFYLLIRKFLHCFFSLMKKYLWDSELLRKLVGVLEEKTFLSDDKCQGNGVNYHIASVFLDELKPFLPLKFESLDILFKPFISAMTNSPDKVMLSKIKGNVFDVLLKMGESLLEVRKSGNDIDSGDEVVLFGTIALVMGFSERFYEMGSSPECLQGNRKVLFSLHQDFLKLEKDLGASGIEISIPEIRAEDEDEVPILIPISNEGVSDGPLSISEPLEEVHEVNGSLKRHSKKKVKAKKGSDGSGKKAKKSNKKSESGGVIENSSGSMDNDDVQFANGEDSDMLAFNESVISNLQLQFEKIAAEAGLDNDAESLCESLKIKANGVSKKRKRAKSMDGKKLCDVEGDAGADASEKSGEKSAKKVRFSMKNNLVWKPHSPLPPQSLRIPPSVTPRGSALKQGIPPGPIREMPVVAKKVKRAKAAKKGRKGIKAITPSVKRLKKLKTVLI